MQLRKWQQSDREAFIQMAHDFYHMPAVLHNVSDSHHARTFDAFMAGNPFIDGYMLQNGGDTIGYALLAITWSNEAGGLCVWIEELYFLPEYRGKGYGHEFFAQIQDCYPQAARFRLECAPDNPRAEGLYRTLGYETLDYHQLVMDKGD